MNLTCMGRTVTRNFCTTDSRVRPLSRMSRPKRRTNRTSASVSRRILMSINSRRVLLSKIRMPSTMIAGCGSKDSPSQSGLAVQLSARRLQAGATSSAYKLNYRFLFFFFAHPLSKKRAVPLQKPRVRK